MECKNLIAEIYDMLNDIAVNKNELPVFIYNEDGSMDIIGSTDKHKLEYYLDRAYPDLVSDFVFGIKHPHVNFRYIITEPYILLQFSMPLIIEKGVQLVLFNQVVDIHTKDATVINYINEQIKNKLPVSEH